VSDVDAWEYMVASVKTADARQLRSQLNGLGAQGWELVSLTSTVKQITGTGGNDLIAVLKRRGLGEIEREEDQPGFVAY
jgi:hypothetical protein